MVENIPSKKNTNSWEIKDEIIEQFVTSQEYTKDTNIILQSKKDEVKKLVKQARTNYQNGNLTDAAKKLRQLATYLKDIQYSIEKKGNYDERNKLNDLTGKEWLRHTKSWLVVDGKPGDIDKEIENHPGTYPPDLAKHFINFFSKKNDWIFDPFMGIGSTLQACKELRRNCWGIELNEKYADYALKRGAKKDKSNLQSFLPVEENNVPYSYQVIHGDSRNATHFWKDLQFPKIKLLITSPPYWNMLETSRGGVESTMKKRVKEGFDQKYSNDDRDLGNVDSYQSYITQLVNLFKNLKEMLQENAYLVIVLQNVRPKDGVMRPVAWDFAQGLAKYYTLRQEFIWLQDQKFMGIWGYPTQYVSNVHHHYCLVFQNSNSSLN